MKDSKGWDGKLRVGQHAEITNPEALEDPEYSDPEAPPVEEIEADEGMSSSVNFSRWLRGSWLFWIWADLLEDEDPETDVCARSLVPVSVLVLVWLVLTGF